MAIHWKWDEMCGEATFRREIKDGEPKDIKVNLYEGNAFLIFIYEWKEGESEKYNLQGFFVDKDHMKRCLGIDKKDKETYGYNMYNKSYDKLVKIRFNKKKSKHYKDIITALVQAFDEIEIEVYSE